MSRKILELLKKYDVPVPRYTSYPTVPYWDFSTLSTDKWKRSVIDTFNREGGELCIYIHLPFCENLCTFCACNKRITKNHKVEDPYISAVLKEWKMYLSFLPSAPVIKEIHLGGGTPTFFSPENLRALIEGITNGARIAEDHEFSIEVHPNYTTEKHLKVLAGLGFNRISVGVQDFDHKVQQAINRIQSVETTREVIDWARSHGYTSVNVDLVYGLPHQTVQSVEYSVKAIQGFMPDRIAFYSYAHVPWKSKGQRRYTEADLPAASAKWEMYHAGRSLLEAAGFKSIGMDHFALENDRLFVAAGQGALHRNFMGYTTTRSRLIIGLGVSAISDSWQAFAQNSKVVEEYEDKIGQGILPLENGHLLNEEDSIIRKNILELMCRDETVLEEESLSAGFIKDAFLKLAELEADGLVNVSGKQISVTAAGGSFIRNISAALDARLWNGRPAENAFSKAI